MTQLLYYEDLNNGKLYTFCAAVSNNILKIFAPDAANPKYEVKDPEQFQAIIDAIANQLGDDKQTNEKKAFLVYLLAAINKTEIDCKIVTNWCQKSASLSKL